MIIKNMFSKPIDRDIKGVIKVGQDDDANIKQELEEYVVTRELQKHFSDFFASYKRGITGNTDKMGVWISGFFGSGKSHFLKILSYLLENKEVGGKKAVDYFVDDNKISDQMVLADMKLAGTIPTDVVLFNIDSKSEVNGKQSKVAIVSVLQNVFNEMQGFSGSNPFLADLERKLTEEGKYDLFKEKFEDSFGSTWEESRSDFDFIQDDVVEVLDEIGFMSVEAGRNWCEKATGEYAYKVEDFARLVKKYLDKKESNHHIVFLIDEIGQYIGDDSKLMLNLQTVTEDLGTACGGKAWIIVTSQQDIDSITKTKGNDFSKIQGRFDTRLSLSSANVDEVIKKRKERKTMFFSTPIDLKKWNEAQWRGMLYLFFPGNDHPPILGFLFHNYSVAKEIFQEWKENMKNGYADNFLRIDFIEPPFPKGCWVNNTKERNYGKGYFVHLGANIDEATQRGIKGGIKVDEMILATLSRYQWMDDSNNRKIFKQIVENGSDYEIMPIGIKDRSKPITQENLIIDSRMTIKMKSVYFTSAMDLNEKDICGCVLNKPTSF